LHYISILVRSLGRAKRPSKGILTVLIKRRKPHIPQLKFWRDRLGTSYTPADYDVWRAHSGQAPSEGWSASSGAAGYPLGAGAEPLSAAVPEPAALMLLTLAAVGQSLPRRRVSGTATHQRVTRVINRPFEHSLSAGVLPLHQL
jgi:hypothetical protein